MKKQYRKLTPDQTSRDIIFSSELVGGGVVHELTRPTTQADWKEYDRQKALLLDDKFFDESPFKYNLIRQ